MSVQTIYYKLEEGNNICKFIKKTASTIIQITIDHQSGETSILATPFHKVNLNYFLVCPKAEFETAFAKAMRVCEGMELFKILGFKMNPCSKKFIEEGSMCSTAQQNNQVY